jgi:hypothetical protein
MAFDDARVGREIGDLAMHRNFTELHDIGVIGHMKRRAGILLGYTMPALPRRWAPIATVSSTVMPETSFTC